MFEKLECKVVKSNGKKFLYRRFNDKIYWSAAAEPDKILKTKSYSCGYITREDFVNKRTSIVPHIRRENSSMEFQVKDGDMFLGGNVQTSTNGSKYEFNRVEIPYKDNSIELGQVAKKYLQKYIDSVSSLLVK